MKTFRGSQLFEMEDNHLNPPQANGLLGDEIMRQSFQRIDQEIGAYLTKQCFTPEEYAIVQRVIHATADFDFAQLIRFSPDAIAAGIKALQQRVPIVTDVNMVKQGIQNKVTKTFQNPLVCALDFATEPLANKTRTETGMLQAIAQFPGAIFVVGNAPTALLSLCAEIQQGRMTPALVVGVPVGFVAVVEAKVALAQTEVPQIRVEGRKGGSPVAAAILNALMILAWESASDTANTCH
ncbi:MAG: cobalt-precorrin-8X methylmutase [Microcoleaceae cyanobacterium]